MLIEAIGGFQINEAGAPPPRARRNASILSTMICERIRSPLRVSPSTIVSSGACRKSGISSREKSQDRGGLRLEAPTDAPATIAYLLGIAMRMFFNDRDSPHFHVRFLGFGACSEIAGQAGFERTATAHGSARGKGVNWVARHG